jgi:RWP-RK domain
MQQKLIQGIGMIYQYFIVGLLFFREFHMRILNHRPAQYGQHVPVGPSRYTILKKNCLCHDIRVMLKDLTFDLVAPKFGMPILETAKQIGVSKSTLRIWCKFNGITRWPHRKIQSMDMLISNVQVVFNSH